MLVEPNPEAFKNLTEKNRKAWTLPQCFSTKTTPEVVEFDTAGLLGECELHANLTTLSMFYKGQAIRDKIID